MKKIIFLKIFGFILIIFAAFISFVLIPNIEKNIFNLEEEIANFLDARVMAIMAVLSYEGRDVLLATQDVEYYQMLNLNYLLEWLIEVEKNSGSKEKYKEELDKLERAMQKTQDVILENNIWLAKRWLTLLSNDRGQDTQNISDRINRIRSDEELSIGQKIDKIHEMQNENQKIFGNRLAEMQEKWLKNRDMKKALDENKSFWYRIFILMQILGLLMLAFAEVMGEIIKNKEKTLTS